MREDGKMTVAERIETKLTDALSPLRLRVVDDSDKHKGHAGWREGGETHFRVEVVSEAFDGKSRVERQRMVYNLLADELSGAVHALQLKTLAPSEDTGR
jgi:BolA protein